MSICSFLKVLTWYNMCSVHQKKVRTTIHTMNHMYDCVHFSRGGGGGGVTTKYRV